MTFDSSGFNSQFSKKLEFLWNLIKKLLLRFTWPLSTMFDFLFNLLKVFNLLLHCLCISFSRQSLCYFRIKFIDLSNTFMNVIRKHFNVFIQKQKFVIKICFKFERLMIITKYTSKIPSRCFDWLRLSFRSIDKCELNPSCAFSMKMTRAILLKAFDEDTFWLLAHSTWFIHIDFFVKKPDLYWTLWGIK